VYFGTTTPPPQVATGIADTTYDPGTMGYETKYYWKIIAFDDQGAFTPGPIWSFTTELAIPDLDCDGTLEWTEIEPGSTATGEFDISNVGDPGSLLNWEISEFPEWGTWSFDPETGTGLTPEESPVTVSVEVVAPDEQNEEFTGEVKIINSDDPNDYCIIQVSLATPYNQDAMQGQQQKISRTSCLN
jgi:hypothetical protein